MPNSFLKPLYRLFAAEHQETGMHTCAQAALLFSISLFLPPAPTFFQKECVSRHPGPNPAFEVSPSELSFHLSVSLRASSLPSPVVSVYLSAGLISTPCSCERETDRSFVSLCSCRPSSFTAVITPATCAGHHSPFILLSFFFSY